MTNTYFSPLAAVAVLLVSTACASQPDDRRPSPQERGNRGANFAGIAAKPISLLFTSMDADANTVLDKSELALGIDREWARLSNGNEVDLRRFTGWSETALGYDASVTGFLAYDNNLNGTMTEAEFSKRVTDEFTTLDTDGNGTLERTELVYRIIPRNQNAGQGQRGQRGQRGQGQRGGRGGGGRGGRGGGGRGQR